MFKAGDRVQWVDQAAPQRVGMMGTVFKAGKSQVWADRQILSIKWDDPPYGVFKIGNHYSNRVDHLPLANPIEAAARLYIQQELRNE